VSHLAEEGVKFSSEGGRRFLEVEKCVLNELSLGKLESKMRRSNSTKNGHASIPLGRSCRPQEEYPPDFNQASRAGQCLA